MAKSILKKSYCIRGHNILEVGRYDNGRGSGQCRECGRTKQVDRYRSDPSYDQNYRKTVKGREVSRDSRWDRLGIKNRDGTTFNSADYNKAYLLQEGKCKICGVHGSELKRSLAADHNHSTGVFRGLLCDKCNRGIGYFNDKPIVAEKAVQYLRNNS